MHLQRALQYARDAIRVTKLRYRHGPKQHIFILSHMRGYTTLLAHILGSHPDIHGYTESHLKLHSRRDLVRRTARIALQENGDLPGRYILDKILDGDTQRIRPALLGERNIVAIFMLRKPLSTLRSIIKMGQDFGWTQLNEKKALSYYVSRLTELGQIALTTNWQCRPFYLDSEELVNNARPTLNQLQNYLDLQRTLSEKYKIFPHTGEAGHGDPSEVITTGKIQQPPSNKETLKILLCQNTQVTARTAYASCREILIKNSQHYEI